MKKTTRTLFKTSLATSLAVVATGSAGVMAAGAPYPFVGSDTLTDVVKDSIVGAGLSSQLTYTNTGSSAAETALLLAVPTQRIAPMSRNFKQAVMDAHPNWTPGLQNIIGLDAAVMVESSNGGGGYKKCGDLAAALDPTFANHARIDTLLGLVLGGKGGVGDTAACSSPERLAALDQLAACFTNVSFIQHFYRRDDRSGTADTMKEKLRIQRFCNGRAGGTTSGADDNMSSTNDDSDPVRRDCIGADATHAKTVCTKFPSTTRCVAGETDCTQGLVVALSQNDPGMSDITTSIARRIRLDTSNQTVGFAGREAAKQGGNTAPSVNTKSPFVDDNVRNSAYVLSRRLFVNFSDIPVGTGRLPARTADDIAQDTAEQGLYDWMTNPEVGGRFNLDPILTRHGFLPCTATRGQDPVSPNLCAILIPPPAAEVTPKQCIPPGVNGNGSDWCCATPVGGQPSTSGTPCPAFACMPSNSACTVKSSDGTSNCCAGTSCTDLGDGNSACQ